MFIYLLVVGWFIGSIVVPFGGSYLESYEVISKRNYYGAYEYYIGRIELRKLAQVH